MCAAEYVVCGMWVCVYIGGREERGKQQSTEEASTPNIGRGAETKSKTTMYSLTTTVRTLPSIAGLQA